MRQKVIVICLMICSSYLYGKTLTLVLDNNASNAYSDENYIFLKNLKEESLTLSGFNKVYILRDRDKAEVFDIKDDDTPSASNLEADDIGIIDSLEKVLSRKYTQDDVIVFFSTMDYEEKASRTSSKTKTYNDAWITSEASPIKRVIDKYPNTPLNKAKVIILDSYKDLNYLKQRERFFSFLFAKIGGRLLYYGSLDFDKERFNNYITSNKELHILSQTPPLREETLLMLDDHPLQYELP